MTANEKDRFDQFAAIMLTELVERTRKNLELLQPEHRPCAPLPFALTPSFIDIYAEVVRVGIYPVVMSRRPVRAIQGDVDWAREGREYLLTVLDDRTNAVFVAWDYAWDALWEEHKAGSGPQNTQKEEKKGFFSALFGRRSAAKTEADTRASEENGDGSTMAGLYTMLNEKAHKRGYLPLFHDDVKVLKGLVRLKPGRLAVAWKELTQYHHQEFNMTGHEQAKPGVLSEALQKWHFTLPERIGELLVLKAAVDLEHVNKPFIGKYIRQSARTQEEAERGMPYLSLYWKAMPNSVMAQS